MADRTVSVSLIGKGQSLVSAFQSAKEGAKGLKGELDDLGQKSPKKFNDIAMAAGGVGLALLGIAGYAVKAAMDFDKQMSEVSAVSNATGADMKALRQAALDAGKETQFSATESAKAEAELAKAGISTADIMGGALKGSLSLAAAGQMDLADSASIAAQTMNMFELKGKDVGHIADVLASAANASAADMHGLGLGLQQVGLVAHQAGFSLEETVGILAAFADRGLQGSDGATSLKTAIQRLTAPTDQAAAEMKALGINVYDANGHIKTAAQIAGNLQDSFGKLSESERNSAMATIFGSDAIRAATVLYGLGSSGVERYTAAVDKNGAAAETAKKKMNNLAGDIEQLKGSLETLAISSGSGANSGLRILVQGVNDVVNAFLGLPGPVQTSIVVLAGFGGASLLAVAGLMKIRQTVNDVRDALESMRASSRALDALSTVIGKVGRVAGPVALVVGGLLLLDSVLRGMSDKWRPVEADVGKLVDTLKLFNSTGHMSGEILRVTGGNFDTFARHIAASNTEMKHMVDVQNGAAKADWSSPVEGALRFQAATKAVGTNAENLTKTGQALAEMYKSGDVVGSAAAYNQLGTALREAGVPQAQINGAMKEYLDLSGGMTASQMQVAQTTQQASVAMSLMNGTLQEAVDKTGSLKAAFDTLNGGFVNSEKANIAANQAIDDLSASFKRNGQTMEQSTQKGRENELAMINVAEKARDVAQATYEQTGSLDKARGAYDSYIGKLKETMHQAGFSEQQIQAFIDKVGQMPPLKQTRIEVPGIDSSILKVIDLQTHLNGLQNRSITVTTVQNTVTGQSQQIYRSGANSFQRWGGAYEHAAIGKLREAGVYSAVSSGARYAFAEPQTGGEAFIPKFGNRGRSMAILNRAASWYGASVGGPVSVSLSMEMRPGGSPLERAMADWFHSGLRSGQIQIKTASGERVRAG